MFCPVCTSIGLVMSHHQGIESDDCPSCQGAWLDRGELDRLVERSAQCGSRLPVNRADSERAYPLLRDLFD